MRSRIQARRLRKSDDPVLAAVGEALRHRLEPEEREWVERIEAERARLAAADDVLETPLRDYSHDESHDHVFEDRVGELVMRASKPPEAARFLFALLRRLRPDRIVELGTALGISAAYQGAALTLNEVGAMVTIDASRARMEVARDVLSRLELDEVVETRLARFQDALPSVLSGEPVGYAFIDGNHDEEATLEYLDLIHPALEYPGIVVFDDIAWSDGMKQAWRTLRRDKRLAGSAEVLGMGICVYHAPAAAR